MSRIELNDAAAPGDAPSAARADLCAGYRPIGDYALIGDTRTAALVSRAGSIDWLCLPSFANDAVFAAILDAHAGGAFAITPAEPYSVERRYAGHSAVLQTTFSTESGRAVLHDMLVLPGDDEAFEPQRELLRVLECLEGRMTFDVRYAPRPRFARARAPLRYSRTLGWRCAWRGHLLTLLTDAPLEAAAGEREARAQVAIEAGRRLTFSLSFSEHDVLVHAPIDEACVRARSEHTERTWRAWTELTRYEGPHREAVLRSAITLKIMTYGLSGAVVAAPTASLPETLGGMRNWDYRFCWLRDASLTMHAFLRLGHTMEAAAFFDWLLHTTRLSRPYLAVVYDVFGRRRMPERELAHFEGYCRSRPVRIGNAAVHQQQLDIYGAVLAAAYEFHLHEGRLDRYDVALLGDLGRAICRLWRRPDHGIWEIRGPQRHYTYGKIMAWVGLDRLLRLGEALRVRWPLERFRRTRDAIREAIEHEAIDARTGALMGAFGDPTPDAALLLVARYGFYEPQHPVMRATEQVIARALVDGPLLYRYPPEWDGMPGREAAFGISSFWRVEYLARAGRVDEAASVFDALCGLGNDVGLFGEEIEPSTHAHLGNFPQAFTHVGLINAALALADAFDIGYARPRERP